MKHTPILIAITSLLWLFTGCQGKKSEVNEAMAELQIALKAYRNDGGREGPMLESWGRIDVSDTPVKFQEAFRLARADYEHLFHNQVAGGAKNYNRDVFDRLNNEANDSLRKLKVVAEDHGAEIRDDVIWSY